METLFTILCIVFILALLLGAHAHETQNLFLDTIANVIMASCIGIFLTGVLVYFIAYLIQLL